MILTPYNSSNPSLWGKDLKFILEGHIVDDDIFKVNLPKGAEFDFITAFNSKDPEGAKRYYAGL